MSESRTAARVGVFVVVAIVVLAATLLVFRKGSSWFTPTYTLRLRAESVGGLKTRAAVLIAGVRSANDGVLSQPRKPAAAAPLPPRLVAPSHR